MKPPAAYLPAASPALSVADQDALTDLYIRGTPANTLRAYERDLLYITAWKAARFGVALDWPRRKNITTMWTSRITRRLIYWGEHILTT